MQCKQTIRIVELGSKGGGRESNVCVFQWKSFYGELDGHHQMPPGTSNSSLKQGKHGGKTKQQRGHQNSRLFSDNSKRVRPSACYRDPSLGSLGADEDLVENLDEVIVLEAAPRALGQATAVAEVGRHVQGGRRGQTVQAGAGLGSTLQDARRPSAPATGAASGTARGTGEHIVRVHRSKDQTFTHRPASAAEPTRDLVPRLDRQTSTSTLIILDLGQGSQTGETDGVQVQHASVVDDRYSDV